jgi:hypothetical protein
MRVAPWRIALSAMLWAAGLGVLWYIDWHIAVGVLFCEMGHNVERHWG